MSRAAAKTKLLPDDVAGLHPELILHDSELGECAFYTWKNVVIACWSKRATGDSFKRFARVRETMDRQHPDGVSVVLLIADGAGLPTPEARAVAKEMIERYRDRRAFLGVVIFGEGFWLSAMRAAIIGVLALTREKTPLKFCQRVEEIAEWLPERHESRTGVRVAPDELLSMLRELSARL